MFGVIATSAAAFIILLITEAAARNKKIPSEVSRKIPHIAGSLAIASWPFFVSMNTVLTLGLLLTFAALVARLFNLFPHSRWVERKTWGEVFFGLGVSLTALAGPNKWVFATAMLYLGLADAMAALVGKHKGKNRYQFFGHVKTVEGSLAFITAAAVITALVVWVAPANLGSAWPVIIWLPVAAAAVEAIAPVGLDNIFLPLLVTAVLTSL